MRAVLTPLAAAVPEQRVSEWERELAEHDALFAKLGYKRPQALASERDRLAGRLAQ